LRHPRDERLLLRGAAGNIETVIGDPGDERRQGLALIAHPHPLYGGTLDNKVVQTLARAFFAQGYVVVRTNFRGVGASDGVFGELPLLLAGFSFGSFVQTQVAQRLSPQRLVLVGPAVNRFPMQHVDPATLVIHGEEDDVVPLRDVLEWARPQSLPIVVIPGAGHFFHGKLVELARVVNRSCAC
jgi:uncharacterized protein